MSINDLMEDEERGRQVIMKDGKAVPVKVVLDELLHKKDGTKRVYSEG